MTVSCSTQIPFHFKLPNLAEQIAKAITVRNYNVCKPIWDKEGSICNAQQVMALMLSLPKSESRKLTLSTSSRKLKQQQSRNLRSPTQPSRDLLKIGAIHNNYQKNTEQQKEEAIKAAHAAMRKVVDTMNQVMKQLRKRIDQSNDFRQHMNQCNAYLSHARDVSICYACSGQHRKYFYNKKALITESDCNAMLQACMPFFRLTFLIISEAGSEQVSAFLFGNSHSGDVLKRIHTAMVNANIQTLVEQFDRSQGALKQNAADQLCLRLFRLHKHQLFREIQTAMAMIKAALEPSRALTAWDLAFGADNGDLFAGDVSIFKAHGGQHSKIIASAGVVPVNGLGFSAMNFSLFPLN